MSTSFNRVACNDCQKVMKHFLKHYGASLAIVALLLIAAAFCYKIAYEDPRTTQHRVNEILSKMDRLYARQATPQDKNEAMLDELLREQAGDFRRVLYEHLALALTIAALLILSVESVTRYMTNRELRANTEALIRELQTHAETVATNVWKGIFNRLVPPQIAEEVQQILKQDVCRISPEYTVIFAHTPELDLPADLVLVRRRLYYRLWNLTNAECEYPITINVTSPTGDVSVNAKNGKMYTFPRICKLEVRKTAIDLTDSQRTRIVHTVKLNRMETMADAWEVYSEVEELYNLTDTALYVLSAPCYDLRLDILNEVPALLELQRDMIHLTSGRDRLKETTPDKWACHTGVLSGTALAVSWKKVTAAGTAVTAPWKKATAAAANPRSPSQTRSDQYE